MINLGPYGKTVTAWVTGFIGWLTEVALSKPTHVTSLEWVHLVAVFAIAAGVYSVANQSQED